MDEDNNIKPRWYFSKIMLLLYLLLAAAIWVYWYNEFRLPSLADDDAANSVIDPVSIDTTWSNRLIKLDNTTTQVDTTQPDTTIQTDSVRDMMVDGRTNLVDTLTHIDIDITQKVPPLKIPTVSGGTLFDKLLLRNTTNKNDIDFIQNLAIRKEFSIKSLVQILSITSKEVLLNGSSDDKSEILETILSSSPIKSITILNYDQQVVYTSDHKAKYATLKDSIPNTQYETKISILRNENSDVLTIPIFHTYGLLGVMKLDIVRATQYK